MNRQQSGRITIGNQPVVEDENLFFPQAHHAFPKVSCPSQIMLHLHRGHDAIFAQYETKQPPPQRRPFLAIRCASLLPSLWPRSAARRIEHRNIACGFASAAPTASAAGHLRPSHGGHLAARLLRFQKCITQPAHCRAAFSLRKCPFAQTSKLHINSATALSRCLRPIVVAHPSKDGRLRRPWQARRFEPATPA